MKPDFEDFSGATMLIEPKSKNSYEHGTIWDRMCGLVSHVNVKRREKREVKDWVGPGV